RGVSRRLGRGGCEHEFVLQRLYQQGEVPVVLDPPELPLHRAERRGAPAQLLIAGPPVGDPMGPGLSHNHCATLGVSRAHGARSSRAPTAPRLPPPTAAARTAAATTCPQMKYEPAFHGLARPSTK